MNRPNQKMFKFQTLEDLQSKVDAYTNLSDYLLPAIEFSSDQVCDSNVTMTDTAIPSLEPRIGTDTDLDNAVSIYNFLSMTPCQAADRRIWSYLSHVTFRDYTMGVKPFKKSLIRDDPKKAATFISQNWFVGAAKGRGLRRDLRRHPLSSLWWLVYLTIAPWERDVELESLKSADELVYTRVILFSDDTKRIPEYNFALYPKVLISFLEFIRCNNIKDRDTIRGLTKEIGRISGYKNLSAVPSVDGLLEVFQDTLESYRLSEQ